jgi:hypothetical protein
VFEWTGYSGHASAINCGGTLPAGPRRAWGTDASAPVALRLTWMVVAPTRGRAPSLVCVNCYRRAEHPVDISLSRQSAPAEGLATQNHLGAMSRRRTCSTPNAYAMLPMAPTTRKKWDPMLPTTSSPLSEAFSVTYRHK